MHLLLLVVSAFAVGAYFVRSWIRALVTGAFAQLLRLLLLDLQLHLQATRFSLRSHKFPHESVVLICQHPYLMVELGEFALFRLQ